MKKLTALLCIFFVFTSFSGKKELIWTAIGDSITFLDGNLGETNNRITKGYMTRVTDKLHNIHFVNQGHNGWTTPRIAGAIETLGIGKSDIYSVFLGTNDWWGSNNLGTIADYQNATGNKTTFGAYRIIINKLRALNPDARIILITPMQRGDFVYVKRATNNAYGSYKDKNGHSLAEFAEAVKAIAKVEHLEVIDLYNKSGITLKNMVKFKRLKDPATGLYKDFTYPAYTNIPFSPEKDEYPYPVEAIGMTYDGLHPSDKGMQVIANMLVKVMKKY